MNLLSKCGVLLLRAGGQIQKLNDLKLIQGTEGNWNYSSYMRGMYNGMELIIAILEGRVPDYKDPSDQELDNLQEHTHLVEFEKAVLDQDIPGEDN